MFVPSSSSVTPVIELSGIGKTYSFHRTRPGLRGSIRDLFGRQHGERVAVADLDLSLSRSKASSQRNDWHGDLRPDVYR